MASVTKYNELTKKTIKQREARVQFSLGRSLTLFHIPKSSPDSAVDVSLLGFGTLGSSRFSLPPGLYSKDIFSAWPEAT